LTALTPTQINFGAGLGVAITLVERLDGGMPEGGALVGPQRPAEVAVRSTRRIRRIITAG